MVIFIFLQIFLIFLRKELVRWNIAPVRLIWAHLTMKIANVTQVRRTRTPNKVPTITPMLCFISSFKSPSAINNSDNRVRFFALKKLKTVISRIKSRIFLLFGMQKQRSFYVRLEIPCKLIIIKKQNFHISLDLFYFRKLIFKSSKNLNTLCSK